MYVVGRMYVVSGFSRTLRRQFMRMKTVFVAVWFVCCVVIATVTYAQGVQTGTLRGVVKDSQELAVPGVTVTATSPVLQGPRSTVTDTQGVYVIRALPPGTYEVKFELNGFATLVRRTPVPLGLTAEDNVSMRAAGVAETVQVVAEAPAAIVTPVVGLNLKHEEIEALATPRTIEGIAQLSPGVSENAPNQGTTGG